MKKVDNVAVEAREESGGRCRPVRWRKFVKEKDKLVRLS